ncbi:hypothetical protein [Acetivibrio clariflavus]|uniref:hypothetical protein n=1 Tax=Acetivibrio clariflavus TaxID=288965 RepID=UPI0004895940|nr:hypothetical protein [Acetivibrio clariflavus]
MAENINRKESLRANGAFACPALELKEIVYEIVNSDRLEELFSDAILEFKREVELFINKVRKEYGDFNSYILEQCDILDEKLLKNVGL